MFSVFLFFLRMLYFDQLKWYHDFEGVLPLNDKIMK